MGDEDQANSLIQSMIEDDLRRQKEKDAARARERAEKKKSPKPVRKVVEAERPKPSSPKKVPRQAASQDKRGFQKHSVRILEEADSVDGMNPADQCRTLAKGPKKCPSVDEVEAWFMEEHQDELCVFSELGWLDNSGNWSEAAAQADLATLSPNVTAVLSEDNIQ